MSANDDRPGREIAHRLFAAEYDDATLSHAESDRERAPNYVITPTGARVNRLFVVGTLTEISSVNEDMIRARIVDPTGAFVVYAGQYQPDELAALESLEPPAFVAITGKARTFQPDDSDRVYTSIRPESVATVDADTRDRWVIDAADRTIERIETYAAAAELDATGEALTEALLATGIDEGPANGIPLAREHYGTTPGYLAALRDLSIEAAEVVAGERDQVGSFDSRPDETGASGVTFGDLAADVDLSTPEIEDPQPGSPEPEAGSATEASADAVDTVDTADVTETADATTAADAGTTANTSTTADAADAASEPEDAVDESAEFDETTAAYDEASVDEPDEDAEAEAGEPVSTAEGEDPSSPADSAPDADDDLGDFDAGDDELYEMDDEERERIESEFGTEFSTGAEVDEPGEADIDVPDEPLERDGEGAGADESGPGEAGETDVADEAIESDDEPATATASGAETSSEEGTDSTAAEPDEADAAEDAEEPAEDVEASDEAGEEPAEDVDVQDLVVETMVELDEGAGADRTAVVEAVVAETGRSEAEVEEAIQDALMGGQCYEPDDETLKAI